MTGRGPDVASVSGSVPHLDRPTLQRLFDAADTRRICVVIGTAGWGKTTAVASWIGDRRTSWMRNDDHDLDPHHFVRRLVGLLEVQIPAPRMELPPLEAPPEAAMRAACGRLHRALREDHFVVIDDLHAVPPDAVQVVETLCRYAPERLNLVLVSRRELPFSLSAQRGRGLVAEINAPDLAFAASEIDVLLRTSIGSDPPDLAERVWVRTAGWPAAVLGAVELLRGIDADGRPAALEQLSRPGERFHGYLLEEVIRPEPEPVRDLLRRLAVCGEVGATVPIGSGVEDSAGALTDLTRRGLVRRSSADGALCSLVPPLADYWSHDTTLSPGDRLLLHLSMAHGCMARAEHAEGLRHLVAGGAHAAAAALLVDHGAALVGSGRVDVVLQATRMPPEFQNDPRVQRVVGHAMQVRGQWSEAAECFREAARSGEFEPALAWRVGQLSFARGEFGEALSACRQARLGSRHTSHDIRVISLAAACLRMTGDIDAARREIGRADAAYRVGGQGVRAAVGQVRAMLAAAGGDRLRAEAHWGTAVESAESEGDLLEAVWARTHRADFLVGVGAPAQALTDLDAAARVAGDCGSPFLTACVATVHGRASLRLGDLEGAHASFGTAVEILQGLGSRLLARPLCGVGELHRVRNQPERSRVAYEEALALSEPVRDVLGIGTALIGLARVRAADDLAVAWSLADRACLLADGQLEVAAFLTRGWVSLLREDRVGAAKDAARAGSAARLRRDAPGVAEAVTLTVLAADDPAAQATLLGEASAIYRESGHLLDEATVRMVAAQIGRGARSDDDAARETLLAAGVDLGSSLAAGPLAATARLGPSLSIRALGPFQVIRDGAPVPRTSWQSKKARDLLKILVARRRPVAREQLMELLWPDEDPAKLGNRLSVLLSMVRDVLAPSPAAGDPVATDGGAVGLNLACVDLDVEEFMSDADDALTAHRADRSDATARLVAAAAGYTGDFLEDDPYPDWAVPLSEELRATHIAVLQAVAVRLREAGDVDGAVRYTLRLLSQDPYDEMAHCALVEVLTDAGRLGEARRHHRTYVRRMNEIGVVPRPLPGVLGAPRRLHADRQADRFGS